MSKDHLTSMKVLLLIAMLFAGAFVPFAATAECRPTADPMIQDCSPALATFSPRIGKNSERSVSGKMLALAASTDGQRLYTGAYSGVWRSDNGGITWMQITHPQPPRGMPPDVTGTLGIPNLFDLAVSPENKDVVLAATGNDTFVAPKSRNGIYRSADGGESWNLVHQFWCPGSTTPEFVRQIVFAPDDSSLVYAAGGCSIAVSRDAGQTWTDSRIIDKTTSQPGIVSHVAAAPRTGSFETGFFIRRIYAAGPNQMWYSQDGGTTWFKDLSANLPAAFGDFTCQGGGCSSAQILAVEPGHADRVYLAAPAFANGPSYYHSTPSKDGVTCNQIKFVDADGNLQWTPGEAIVSESIINNSTYNAGEPVIVGTAPAEGTRLRQDGTIKFVDKDGNGVWNQGETVVYTAGVTSDSVYDAGEPVIIGTAPPAGTELKDPRGCGEGSLWIGNYANFFSANSANWEQLPGPPLYFGGSTISGRVYVVTHALPRITASTQPYLLFFGDVTHVHVSFGRPELAPGRDSSNSWHRLDGRDVSQAYIDNERCNRLFVHVDPQALVVSSDFNLRLKPAAGADFPYNQNSVLDESFPVEGTMWMANDGGVYRNRDFRNPVERINLNCEPVNSITADVGMSWGLGDQLATLQVPFPFAGVAVAGKPPALYFGTPDNDNYFSLDGGATWRDPQTTCRDCGAWFADPAQPNRVIEFGRGPYVVLHVSPSAAEYPDAGARHPEHSLGPDPAVGSRPIAGYRPLILTGENEAPLPDGDVILVDVNGKGNRALLRTTKLSQITTDPQDWRATAMEDGANVKVFQQGPDFDATMARANVVQASGGHGSPVFYVGEGMQGEAVVNGENLWKCGRDCVGGQSGWQRIVPASDGSAKIARRFFANPYDPNEVYIIDENAIKRSIDGGTHWLPDVNLDRMATEDGRFRYDITRLSPGNPVYNAVLKDMIFVRGERTRFAIGNAGVFFSLDGNTWERLLSTQAFLGHPVAAYFDAVSDPSNRALYVGFDGRGIIRISPIPSQPAAPIAARDLVRPVKPGVGPSMRSGHPGFRVSLPPWLSNTTSTARRTAARQPESNEAQAYFQNTSQKDHE
jgi:hypothetical protein